MAKREIHNAIVTRNTDQDLGVALRGGVFFNAPTLFDGEYPEPALPCFPYASSKGAGLFFVPQVGDEIEVEILVDDGTFDTSDIEVPEPRWRCMIYSQAADIADEFKKNYTRRMGWKTNSGHLLLFDDKEGQELIQLAHKIGTFLKFEANGNWIEKVIKDKVSDIAGKIMETVGGDFIETISGKKVINVTGNVEVNTDGEAKVTAQGKVTVVGNQIELNGGGALEQILTTPSAISDFTGAPIQVGSSTVKATN